jgi:hypothetical protein
MGMEIVNKPVVSRKIAAFYVLIIISIAILILVFSYLAFSIPAAELSIASSVLIPIEVVFLLLLRSLYHTRYTLVDGDLVIKTTRLVALTTKEKRIPIREVETIQRTLIPFGFRLFGASFYGGHYYIPGLGRAFVAMTNFNDGVLIRTKEGNYIITPRDPDGFIRLVKERLEGLNP